MQIGVLKEIKTLENRVALTPAGARALVDAGHDVCVESGAGEGSGFDDGDYEASGASLVSAEAAWDSALVLKVKEPLASEYRYLSGQIVFTYFHLSGVDPELTRELLESKTTAVAYETVEDATGKLPLLAPMSAVAGNMAVMLGNYYLARFNGGKGMLLGSVLGRGYGKVVIIGDGVVGLHAARAAHAMGAQVHLAGRHSERATDIAAQISPEIRYLLSEPGNIAREIVDADLVIGGVLIRGGKAPHVVTESMVKAMQPGSVIVDVSIDQGGCVETARPTSHAEPVYSVHGVTHYCVTNMPGAYPRTSTFALTDATLPYARKLADRGMAAFETDAGFAKGVNTHNGFITCEAVSKDLGLQHRYRPL